MLAEYDFSQGVRGKYAQRYHEGTNIVVLSPDVAEYFPDSEAVKCRAAGLDRDRPQDHAEGGPLRCGASAPDHYGVESAKPELQTTASTGVN